MDIISVDVQFHRVKGSRDKTGRGVIIFIVVVQPPRGFFFFFLVLELGCGEFTQMERGNPHHGMESLQKCPHTWEDWHI